MSEQGFTPGPWSVRIEPYEDDPFPGRDYCSIHMGQAALRGIITPADAHLIAAAPDLYEALGKVEKRLFAFGHVQTNLDRHDVASMLDIVRAALAKARGEIK